MARDLGYFRGVIRGANAYGRQKNWVFQSSSGVPESVDQIREWHASGLIAHIGSEQAAAAVRTLGLPVVNTSNSAPVEGIPRVKTDDVEVGRLAARHLLERGFRHFGYYGYSPHMYSQQRMAGFSELINEAGHQVDHFDLKDHAYHPVENATWGYVDPDLAAWLHGLPKPAGILCFNDGRATLVTDTCRLSGLRVPEDVAVVGVDNDTLFCELCNPPVSSVAIPFERMGYEAAALLDRMMAGEAPPDQPIVLPPGEVVQRASTDTLAIEDQQVLRALRFIRENISRQISVDDVVRVLAISRRSLERRFDQLLKRSPLDEIRRIRLAKVKELLGETDLSMPVVAQRCGFPNAERLSVVFHDLVGMTPTAYRRQYRLYE